MSRMFVKASKFCSLLLAAAAYLLVANQSLRAQEQATDDSELIDCSSIYDDQPRRRRPGRPKPPLWP